MRRRITKWFRGALLAPALLAVVVAGRGVVGTSHSPSQLVLTSGSCSSGSGFCVTSPSPGPVLYPGAAAAQLTLTFTNYTSAPLHVTQITLTFTNSFPAGCDSSAFHVTGPGGATGTPPSVTLALPGGLVTVPAATGATPGTVTYPDPTAGHANILTLALANSAKSQNSCHQLSGKTPLAMSYVAQAFYTAPTTTSMTVPNQATVEQPQTLTATVSSALSPSNGVKPVGTANFYACPGGTSCAQVGTGILNSSGSASTTWTPSSAGSYTIYASYNPGCVNSGCSSSTPDFGSSSSSSTSQTVAYTQTISGKSSKALTVGQGQTDLIQSSGSVTANVTINGGGRLDIAGGSVTGSVTNNGGGLNAQSGTISGNLISTGATFLNVCRTQIAGSLNVASSTAFALIGDGGDDGSPGCAGNNITGNVTAANNAAGLEIGSDAVSGSLALSGNTGAASGTETSTAPEVESNNVSGSLSCSSDSPAAIDGGHSNTINGKRPKTGECSGTAF